LLFVPKPDESVEQRLSDLSKGMRGEREGVEVRSGLIFKFESATVAREERESEVVDDETKNFGGEMRQHD
jgi:hypothetical protein